MVHAAVGDVVSGAVRGSGGGLEEGVEDVG
jgi:hypothetical protein